MPIQAEISDGVANWRSKHVARVLPKDLNFTLTHVDEVQRTEARKRPCGVHDAADDGG